MNRYVAFLDILGFSDLVDALSLDELKARVKKAFESVAVAQKVAPMVGIDGQNVRPIYHHSFSDTFMILSDDASPAAFLSFLIATTFLTRTLFAQALPVRGAIVFGEADFASGKEHPVGKAIVEAANFEKSQEWFGVTFKDIQPDVVFLLESDYFKPVLKRWDVPTKDGNLPQALVVNWHYNLEMKGTARSLFSSSKEPKKKSKFENTMAFVSFVEEQGWHKGPDAVLNAGGEKIFSPWLEPIAVV